MDGQRSDEHAIEASADGSDQSDQRTRATATMPLAHRILEETPPRRRWKSRRVYSALAVVLALAVIGGGVGALVVALRSPTRSSLGFHAAACPFTPATGVAEGRDVRCGYVVVPQDHSQPKGPVIKLAVAVFASPNPSPKPDPVLILNGGPGTPLLEYSGPGLTPAIIGVTWSRNRDLILVDQRGVGYSRPSLDCVENTTMPRATNLQRVQACRDRLIKEGVNLNDYNTIQNAEDIHDVIHALGYRQVNLDGVSYATRLELTVMRLYPEDVRTVLLDSTSPPQVDIDTGFPAATQRAFDTLFQGCAANSFCNHTYPHLQAVFAQLVTDLNQHPVTIQGTDPATGKPATATITGDDVINGMRDSLYDTSLIPLLPKLIYQLANHDYSSAASISQQAQANQGSSSVGMALAVSCGESILTPQTIPAAVQPAEPETRNYYVSSLQTDYAVCQIWNVPPVPAEQRQPVTSAIPTLIYAGEYDPTTPPAYGKLAASTLSNSHFYQFPGVGHVVLGTSPCSVSIYQAFVDDPSQQPDASCIQGLMGPFFR